MHARASLASRLDVAQRPTAYFRMAAADRLVASGNVGLAPLAYVAGADILFAEHLDRNIDFPAPYVSKLENPLLV